MASSTPQIVTGQIRVIAQTVEDAEQISAYLAAVTERRVVLSPPGGGRYGQFISYGTIQIVIEDERTPE